MTDFLSIGEGVVDDSVWMVKTHYPERMGYLKFKARRIVLLVRNPFDAIESYFHMGMTNTHDKHLSPQVDNLTVQILGIYCIIKEVYTHERHLNKPTILAVDGPLSTIDNLSQL